MRRRPIYLYVTPFFPSPTSWAGGFCLDAVKALTADGRHEVVVMTGMSGGYDETGIGDYEIDGVRVYAFPRLRIGASEYLESLLTGWNNRLFRQKLAQVGIDPQDVAVCHVHDFEHYVQYALTLKDLNPKCRTLVHHHYAGYYKLDIGRLGVVPIWSDLLYCKMRREFEAVDAHVFISEHGKRKYGRRVDFDTGEDKGLLRDQLPWGRFYRPIRCPRSYVWYNGVDSSLFYPLARNQQQATRNPQPTFTLGCVANFNPCKRQIDLIRAFEIVIREIPQAVLKLVGSGRTRPACEAYVKAHGLERSVSFLDPMPHDRLADFYRTLDLFVMPSVNEGFCCVNVEALACGVPFIAVKGLPMEEVLAPEDRDTWLVAPHDVRGLAEKILAFAAARPMQRLAVDLGSKALARRFLDEIEQV